MKKINDGFRKDNLNEITFESFKEVVDYLYFFNPTGKDNHIVILYGGEIGPGGIRISQVSVQYFVSNPILLITNAKGKFLFQGSYETIKKDLPHLFYANFKLMKDKIEKHQSKSHLSFDKLYDFFIRLWKKK